MFIYCICTQYLVGAPFALITASIQSGMEVISLWHWYGSPGFFDSGLQLICMFWSLVSHFPLDHTSSGLVSLLASQAHQHHGHLTFLQTLGTWFPNEIQNLHLSEKRISDHWATVQFFFSLAQVRRL